jgi:spore germination cell wall hydrolase CwlJ-like protein
MDNLYTSTDKKGFALERYVIVVMLMLSMAIGLYGCVNLFNWVLDKKYQGLQTITGNEITAELRERQLGCLARNIYFEAGNEPFEGKVAVAQVTINRTNSDLFPKDLCRVVYQKNVIYERVICQFSWYCDRMSATKILHKPAYDESMEVAKKVLLEGFRLPSLTEALYYHADYVQPGWKKERITKIGRHIFYK